MWILRREKQRLAATEQKEERERHRVAEGGRRLDAGDQRAQRLTMRGEAISRSGQMKTSLGGNWPPFRVTRVTGEVQVQDASPSRCRESREFSRFRREEVCGWHRERLAATTMAAIRTSAGGGAAVWQGSTIERRRNRHIIEVEKERHEERVLPQGGDGRRRILGKRIFDDSDGASGEACGHRVDDLPSAGRGC